ncbi:MAG: glycosyltransferase [Fibromonadaceae bacterium]|jgi:glycosyltransferase involved in cell wall biosynthesis|nr:glycosyltransferase [Fibromonadaceae bacterium]
MGKIIWKITKMIKLSIITINRNNANGLKQTLASVAEQTFKDFEHIVIDGASTDDSVDVIKKFPHIAYYVSESDNGRYDAMNKGIKQAKGEYCLFLNSGDYLASQTVLEQVFLNSFNEDIIYGNILFKNLEGSIQKIAKPKDFSISFFIEDTFGHPSSFTKTELLIKLKGYRTDMSIVSDWAFFLEAIYVYGASYKYLPIFISVFITDGICSDTNNIPLIQAEREKVWKDLFPYTYKDILRIVELEIELKRVYKIPGVKFIMKYVYPLYKRLHGT